MKQLLTRFIFLCFLFTFCFSGTLTAQIGIGTITPNGILDINSSTQGVVLPVMALTATNVMAPAINPQTGSLAAGTVIFNTATTTSGSFDVSPGMYMWNGIDRWVPQFDRKQSQIFRQNWTPSVTGIRPVNGSNAIPGLTSPSFTANYTGYYKVKVIVNYGGGSAIAPTTNQGSQSNRSDGTLNIARQSGNFIFTIGGVPYTIPAHSYSTAYKAGTGTGYFAIWQEFSMVIYTQLTANQSTSFNLIFTQNPGAEFINNGNSGDGRGYVGYDIPCSVEFTYLGDEI